MNWRWPIMTLALAGLLPMLAGCVATQSRGQRFAATGKPVDRMAVLVQYASFEKGNTASSIGNREVGELFPHVAQRLPVVFALNRIDSKAAYVSADAPLPPELQGFDLLLRIWPQSVSWNSRSGSTLTVAAELQDRRNTPIVWRGSILLSTLGFGKFDAALADQLAAKLLEQLRHDGVITPAANQGAPKQHHRQVPPATGHAAIDDVDAVPVRPEGKDRYRHYLTLPAPKAFSVDANGGWRFAFNDRQAMSTLLDHCAREGKPCWLYAVDERVVWNADVDKRIAKTSQLPVR